jgi:flagellin FlaB
VSEFRGALLNKIKIIKNKKVGAIGIGAMIIFIAMVLVAGIAASVLIQTSTRLESQALQTGRETTKEVSTGIAIYDIEGYAPTNGKIEKMVIMVRPRAGSDGVDLGETYIELSNSSRKVILNYTTSFYAEPTGQDDIFSASVFPDDEYGYGNPSNTDGSRFGILVIEDADNSFTSATTVVMNRGDKAFLCINCTGCFNNISERTDMWGMVIPEIGAHGMIAFRTPSTYSGKNVFDLQ